MLLCIGFLFCRLQLNDRLNEILRQDFPCRNERENASEKTVAGTTFGENGKEKALYLSTGIASIGFWHQNPIHTLKGCGLYSGDTPEYPVKSKQQKQRRWFYEKQGFRSYFRAAIRRRKRKVRTLGRNMRTIAIRICVAAMQGQNTETETHKRVLATTWSTLRRS